MPNIDWNSEEDMEWLERYIAMFLTENAC